MSTTRAIKALVDMLKAAHDVSNDVELQPAAVHRQFSLIVGNPLKVLRRLEVLCAQEKVDCKTVWEEALFSGFAPPDDVKEASTSWYKAVCFKYGDNVQLPTKSSDIKPVKLPSLSPAPRDGNPIFAAKNQNELLKTITMALKLDKLPDPTSSSELSSFSKSLLTYRSEIVDYLKSNKFSVGLGFSYLRTLLQDSKSRDLRNFEYQLQDEHRFHLGDVKDLDKAISVLCLIDEAHYDFDSELAALKSGTYSSSAEAWRDYTALLNKFPEKDQMLGELTHLENFRALLKYHVNWPSLDTLLTTAEVHGRIKSLQRFRVIIQKLEGKIQSSSVDINEMSSKPICKFFRRGHCRYGNNCKFSHGRNPSSQRGGYSNDRDRGSSQGGDTQGHQNDPLYQRYCFNHVVYGNCKGCPRNHASLDDILKLKGRRSCVTCSKSLQGSRGPFCKECYAYVKKLRPKKKAEELNVPPEGKSTSTTPSLVPQVTQEPASTSIPEADERVVVYFQGDKSGKIDSMAEVSMAGSHMIPWLRSNGAVFSPCHVMVTGVVKGRANIATQWARVELPLVLANGARTPFQAHILVSEHYDDFLIGWSDMRRNSLDLCTHGGVAVRKAGSPVKWSTVSGRPSRGTTSRVESLRVVKIAEFQVAKAPKPTPFVLFSAVTDPYDLTHATDDPTGSTWPSMDAITDDSKERDTLTRYISPFGDISGPTASKIDPASLMAKFLLQMERGLKDGSCILSTDQFYQIRVLLLRFQNQFHKKLPKPGTLKNSTYTLKGWLTSESPIRKRPYRFARPKMLHIDDALRGDVARGLRFHPKPEDVINTIPVFGVYERNKLRVVGNFTALNEVTRPDPWPVPIVQDSLDAVLGYLFYFALDGLSGYQQCSTDFFTAMRTILASYLALYGTYVLDWGLRNAGQHFCKVVDNHYAPEKKQGDVVQHVDDLVGGANTFPVFFMRLLRVLVRAESCGLIFKLMKCSIGMLRTPALGVILHARDKSRKPDPARLEPIRAIQPARSVKEAQSIIGLFVYWQDFIPGLQKLTAPIRAAIKVANDNNDKFRWTPECDRSVSTLRNHILNDAVLYYPRYSLVTTDKPFRLWVDASGIAMGYILSQEVNGKPHLLKCGSRCFRRHELNHHITRKEFMVVVWAAHACKLLCAYRPTLVLLDARNSLFFIKNYGKALSPVFGRLAASLQGLGYLRYQHVKGAYNYVSDYFSRYAFSDEELKLLDEDSMKTNTPESLFPAIAASAKAYNDLNPSSNSNPATALVESATVSFAVEAFNLHTFGIPVPEIAATAIEALQTIDLSSLSDVVLYQREDSTLRPIFQALEDEKHVRHSVVSMHWKLDDQGTLLHISPQPDPITELPVYQVAVPENYYEAVFDVYHSAGSAAHHGYKETLRRILRRFYWPSVRKTVKTLVQNCDACIRTKAKPVKLPYPTFIAPRMMYAVAADFVGPFPKSRRGNRYLLTFTILSTLWPEAFPCVSPDSRVFAHHFLQDIICRYGCPDVLHTDLGSHFVNSVVESITHRLHLRHSKTSLGNKRGLSIKERQHYPITCGVMAHLLMTSSRTNASKADWDLAVAPALFAMRNSVPRGREYSSSERMFGEAGKFPGELPEAITNHNPNLRQVAKNVQEVIDSIKTLRNLAAQADEDFRTAANEKSKCHRAQEIKIGDPVWLYVDHDKDEHKTTGKLDSDWVGPYFVIQIVQEHSHNRYILQHSETGKPTVPVYRRQIRKASLRRIPLSHAEVKHVVRASSDAKEVPPAVQNRPTRNRRVVSNFAPMVWDAPYWQAYNPTDC